MSSKKSPALPKKRSLPQHVEEEEKEDCDQDNGEEEDDEEGEGEVNQDFDDDEDEEEEEEEEEKNKSRMRKGRSWFKKARTMTSAVGRRMSGMLKETKNKSKTKKKKKTDSDDEDEDEEDEDDDEEEEDEIDGLASQAEARLNQRLFQLKYISSHVFNSLALCSEGSIGICEGLNAHFRTFINSVLPSLKQTLASEASDGVPGKISRGLFKGEDVDTGKKLIELFEIGERHLAQAETISVEGHRDGTQRSGDEETEDRSHAETGSNKVENENIEGLCLFRWLPKQSSMITGTRDSKGEIVYLDVVSLTSWRAEAKSRIDTQQQLDQPVAYTSPGVPRHNSVRAGSAWSHRVNDVVENAMSSIANYCSRASSNDALKTSSELVHRCLEEALENVGASSSVTADAAAGSHSSNNVGTGRKNCYWPLVQAFFEKAVDIETDDEQQHCYVQKIFTYYKLWLLTEVEGTLKALMQQPTIPNSISFHSTCKWVSALCCDLLLSVEDLRPISDSSISQLVSKCIKVKSKIEYEVFPAWLDKLTEAERSMNSSEHTSANTTATGLFKCTIPELHPNDTSAHEADRTALSNLSPYSWKPKPKYRSIEQLHRDLELVMESHQQDFSLIGIMLLQTEEFIWREATAQLKEDADNKSLFQLSSLEGLVRIVQRYRNLAAKQREGLKNSENKLQPTCALEALRSKEILILWTSYCLTHRSCSEFATSHIREFLSPLDPTFLAFLLLKEKRALEVAVLVTNYINHINSLESASTEKLFHLTETEGTLKFAAKVASNIPFFQEQLKVARQETDKWVDKRWESIQRTKKRVEEIREQARKLRKTKMEFDDEDKPLESHFQGGAENHNYKRKKQRYEKKVYYEEQLKIKENEEKTVLKDFPECRVLPMPLTDSEAYQALFFEDMPPEYDLLCKITILAQQAVIPRKGELKSDEHLEKLKVQTSQAEGVGSWRTHFENQKSIWEFNRRCFTNGSNTTGGLAIYGKFTCESNFGSILDFVEKRTGLSYPQVNSNSLYWYGISDEEDQLVEGGGAFNPFKASYEELEDMLTAQLEVSMPQPPDDSMLPSYAHLRHWTASPKSKRGNYAVAGVGNRNNWDNPYQFQRLAGIRAFPQTQVRRILGIFHQKPADPSALDLKEPDAHTLCVQALCQVGEISSSSSYTSSSVAIWDALVWKRDLSSERVRDQLERDLRKRYEEIKNSPAKVDALWLVSKITCFFAQWYPKFRELSRSISKAFLEIGSQMLTGARTQEQENSSELRGENENEEANDKYGRALQIFAFGISCHKYGKIDQERGDIEDLVQLSFMLGQAKSNAKQIPLSLLQSSEETILSCLITVNDSDILQSLKKCAFPHIISFDVEWKPVKEAKFCYEAKADVGQLAVNLVNGVVLINKQPLGSLPDSVFRHELYQDVFGAKRFTTFTEGDGTISTTGEEKATLNFGEKAATVKYNFAWTANADLLIKEIHVHDDFKFELCLLPNTADILTLPVRQRHRFSHWYCISQNRMLIRPKHFAEDSVFYICEPQHAARDDSDQLNTMKVFKTPTLSSVEAFRASNLEGLYEELLPHPSVDEDGSAAEGPDAEELKLLDSLSRMEDRSYIEIYKSPGTGNKTFSLPRYSLNFSGEGESREWKGFFLAKHHDRLRNTLIGFTQLLLLENVSPSAIDSSSRVPETQQAFMLVPYGRVTYGTQENLRFEIARTLSIYNSGETDLDQDQVEDCHRSFRWNKFDIHPRFNTLKGADINGQLQLAALYAISHTGLTDQLWGIKGLDVSLELLKSISPKTQLTTEQLTVLNDIRNFGAVNPSLVLRCHFLNMRSLALAINHGDTDELPNDADFLRASNEYKKEFSPLSKKRTGMHELFEHEERYLRLQIKRRRIAGARTSTKSSLNPTFSISKKKFINGIEEQFSKFLRHNDKPKEGSYPLKRPGSLNASKHGVGDGTETVSEAMHKSLASSYHQAQKLPVLGFASNAANVAEFTQHALEEVKLRREKSYEKITETLDQCPREGVGDDITFRLGRAKGLYGHFFRHGGSSIHLIPLALNKENIVSLNPFLAPGAMSKLQEEVCKWMALGVLEDKCYRIFELAKTLEGTNADNEEEVNFLETALKTELRVKREWDYYKHPWWLAFELEGQLQIRQEQYQMANAMLKSRGKEECIFQMNMGLGKTRVIVPMLVLEHIYSDKALARVNVLDTMFGETFDHLVDCLSASILSCPVLVTPFTRQHKLRSQEVKQFRYLLEMHAGTGACFVVTREQRHSMELKALEARLVQDSDSDSKSAAERLGDIHLLNFKDILDESDELLHYRYELAYAIGEPESLPDGDIRWATAQALLQIIHKPPPRLESLFGWKSLVEYGDTFGQEGKFQGIRFIPGEALEENVPMIHEELFYELFNPSRKLPYELNKLRDMFENEEEEEWCKMVAIDPSWNFSDSNTSDYLEASDFFEEELDETQRSILLCLRGFLAHRVLLHCLSKRHRVDFGLDESRKKEATTTTVASSDEQRSAARKWCAVPFRACDTPSERADFEHPECIILYTLLSHYYSGLTLDNATTCLETLTNTRSLQQREDEYKFWSENGMVPSPSVTGVDVETNESKKKSANHILYNIGAINYWLNTFVFPEETKTFTKRISRTAWDYLPRDNEPESRPIGFSGTNDEHLLLPLSLRQASGVNRQLDATNGIMLNKIMENSTCMHVLSQEQNLSVPRSVLNHCKTCSERDRADALLDVGALMAGMNNFEVAKWLVENLTPRRPIVFFDTSIHAKEWRVMLKKDESSQAILTEPLVTSSVKPEDAFVYFDENRCRGVDMKLRPNAVGILTIGPNITKSRVMQGAGRLRKLGEAQTLKFVCTNEVNESINMFMGFRTTTYPDEEGQLDSEDGGSLTLVQRNHSAPTRRKASPASNSRTQARTRTPGVVTISPKDMLAWVMHNTVQGVIEGFSEWSRKGIAFYLRRLSTEDVQKRQFKLQHFYQFNRDYRAMSKVVHGRMEDELTGLRTLASEVRDKVQKAFEDVEKQVIEWAGDYQVITNTFSEECEKELEEEAEAQKETEELRHTHYDSVTALAESDLDVGALVSAPAQDHRLKVLSAKLVSDSIREDLEVGNMICNGINLQNLYCTKNFWETFESQGNQKKDNYLRLLDGMLFFYDNCDCVLISERETEAVVEFIRNGHLLRKIQLVHFLFLEEWSSTFGITPALHTPSASPRYPVIVSVKLFNGDVTFGEVHDEVEEEGHEKANRQKVNEQMKRELRFNVLKENEERVDGVKAMLQLRRTDADLERSDLEQCLGQAYKAYRNSLDHYE